MPNEPADRQPSPTAGATAGTNGPAGSPGKRPPTATTPAQRHTLEHVGPEAAEGHPGAPTHPAALSNGLQVLLGIAAACVAIAGMRAIPDIIGPTFLALTLAITVYPVQARLATKLPRWAAMVLSLLLVYAILIGFLVALGWSLAKLALEVPTYKDQLGKLAGQAVAILGQFGIGRDKIQGAIGSIDPGSAVGVAQAAIGSASGVASQFLFVLTVAIFLAVDSMDFERRLDMIEESHPALVIGLRKFAKGVRSYWWVTTVFGLIVAVLNVASLWFIGVPLIFTWGVLSFLTNYIPNIGFVLGMVPPTLMALLVKGPVAALLVIITYSVFNFVIQSVIQPKFTGDSVGVNTTMAFLSLMFWSYVMGGLGAILALPMTLLIKNLFIDINPQSRWVNLLMASSTDSAAAIGSDVDRALLLRDMPPGDTVDHAGDPVVADRPDDGNTEAERGELKD